MGALPPSTPEEARLRLRALGLRLADADALLAHFDDPERRGKKSHGYARIPWLEQRPFDREARPARANRQWGSIAGMGTAPSAT